MYLKKDIILSFILTCYNEEVEIVRAINSILYANLDPSLYEIIVVDDGSTDNSINIIKSMGVDVYMAHEDGINLQSRGIARNVGIRNSLGEYVVFLDGNDYYDSLMLNKMFSELVDNQGYDIYSNPYYYIEYGIVTKKQNIVDVISRDNPMSYIVKKDYLFKNDLLFHEGDYSFYCEDLFFAMRIYEKTNNIYRTDNKPFIIHNKEMTMKFFFNENYHNIMPRMFIDLRKIVTKEYLVAKVDMEEGYYLKHYINMINFNSGNFDKITFKYAEDVNK